MPVLMLTARGEDVDRIVGLELGADDYLPKPFNPRELVARIQAILRRTAPAAARAGDPAGSAPPIVLHDLAIHLDRREATYSGHPIPLTTVEFDVLHLLAAASGRVVSRDEISKHALGRTYSPYDRSVDMHVSNLRRKLQRMSGDQVLIKTVRSAGYILVLERAAGPGEAGMKTLFAKIFIWFCLSLAVLIVVSYGMMRLAEQRPESDARHWGDPFRIHADYARDALARDGREGLVTCTRAHGRREPAPCLCHRPRRA